MIVTVTANPALDITYRVDDLRLGETNRVASSEVRGGGNGVNVASVLCSFGYPGRATGILAGPTGRVIAMDMERRGLRTDDFVQCEGDNRRTVVLVTGGRATSLVEPGPVVAPAALDALEAKVAALLYGPGPHVLVLSGSLPTGAPADYYARLMRAAGPEATTIVDAHGAPLIEACAAEVTLARLNRAELAATTGRDDPCGGARELRRRGAEAVLVTDGPHGFHLLPCDGPTLHVRLPSPLAGNPVGAGDAVTAALAAGYADGDDIAESLVRAAAWGGAAVTHPNAGTVPHEKAEELAAHVLIDEVG